MNNNDLELTISFAIIIGGGALLIATIAVATNLILKIPCREHKFIIPPDEKKSYPRSFFLEFTHLCRFQLKQEFVGNEPRCKRCWKKLTELYPEIKVKP